MFATRLKIALDKREMKPAVLAYRLGVDRSTISNYLKGKYTAKIDVIRKIAKILDVSPDWLSGLDVPVEENTTPTDELVLNDGEKALVKLFRSASPYQREIILQLLAAKITPKE